MFVELLPLLRNRTVLLTLSHLDGDTIRVNVIPKLNKEEEAKHSDAGAAVTAALTVALKIDATAAELDAEFPEALVKYVGRQLGLKAAVEEMQKDTKAAEDAAKEASKAAIAAAKKKGTPTIGNKAATATTFPGAPVHEKAPEPLPPPSLFDAIAAEESAANPEAPAPIPEAVDAATSNEEDDEVTEPVEDEENAVAAP